MKTLRRLWMRALGSLAGAKEDDDLARELESHVQIMTDELVARGVPPPDAWRQALLAFGGVEVAKEHCRDQRGFPVLDSLRQDLRYALRGMRRNPVFTAFVVACLALGIGATTAIFSVVSGAKLRSLPVSHPERLAFFTYSQPPGGMGAIRRLSTGFGGATFPWATYEAFRDQALTLSGVFVYASTGVEGNSMTIDAGGRPFVADGEMVTGGYFPTLGVSPVLGRAIVDRDLAVGASGVVVVSHKLWMREFGGLSSAIGRSIWVNTEPFTIVGVTPPGFAGLSGVVPDLWLPLRPSSIVKPWNSRSASPDAYYTDRQWWWCMIGGRMRPGATLREVQAETAHLFAQSVTVGGGDVPARLPLLSVSNASPVFQRLRQGLSTPLGILFITASLMLLMACANVAALLAARAKARQREIGVRLAIGASRARVIRQLLTESSLLSACGGMLGLVFAHWGAPALLELIVGRRQPTPLDVSPDRVVLAFAAALSVGTGILFGLAPALRAAREDLAPQLTEAARSSTPRGGLGKALVGFQVALSVILLFGAGLFVRTLHSLDGQRLGFQREDLLLFDIDPVRSGYTGARGRELHNRLAERIGQLPGVTAVTYVQEALLSGYRNSTPTATDGGVAIPAGRPDEDFYNRVGPQFFETMGMRILLGRGIERRDTNGEHAAAVVNESWARAHFPGENPVGHRLSAGGNRFDPQYAYEIVGVAEDAKYHSLRDAPPRTVYIGYGEKWARARRMCFVVRSAASPAALGAAVTDAVHDVDPALPVYNVRTQRQQIEEAMGTERTLAGMSSFFGVLALLLVAIGVYGTLAYTVTQRTGEIGIRMALGARRGAVVWMILRESLGASAFGLCAGLAAALALSGYAERMLFGVGARDGVTIAATVGILSAIAAVSALLPANRAARVDPIRALRHL